MKKIGLALSGGGFRATLYHLGLVRFLRDAGVLPQITHITSVSGGSIMAAHLVLNWDRYSGSAKEFEAAAAELLAFTRLDVRNRILRRFPLGLFVRWPRLLLGLSNRQFSRTWWLESMYEKHLYGDKSLFELPESPQLHMLSTNLSEGCLVSFNRDGLWMLQRKAGNTHIERIRVPLMTVPMAVCASSAFPGFFPPLELTGRDIGARGGEFGRQSYTDGGVFDNLGVRCFRWLDPLQKMLDGVLVSDVAKRMVVQDQQRGGGIIRAALRASDILMERVGQLESEIFEDAPGFVFARISDVIDPRDDPTVLHPEIQRQAANIRTDLDKFSHLEISCLIRHGYCLGRKACRSRPDLFGAELPTSPPWDPVPPASIPHYTATDSHFESSKNTGPITTQARDLQVSASRRIWSRLLSLGDWPSYIYIPILLAVLFLLPYLVLRSYRDSRRVNRLIESITLGSSDFEIKRRLVIGPIAMFKGEVPEDVRRFEPPNYKGFSILQDSRIVDLRLWNPTEAGKTDPNSLVYAFRRLKVLRNSDNSGNDLFRIATIETHSESQFRFPPQPYRPRLRRMCPEKPTAHDKSCQFEVGVDLSKLPTGEVVDVTYEHYSAGVFLHRGEISSTVSFRADADAAEVMCWVMMPRGRECRSFQILRYEKDKAAPPDLVKGLTEYLADDASIIAFTLASVKAGYTYEVTWMYK